MSIATPAIESSSANGETVSKNAGLSIIAGFHSPHPTEHFGLSTRGASHSPSSSSSQSSGICASGSATCSGSSSSQPSGLKSSGSSISRGASSSQSSGLKSSGSSICLGGLTGGSKSSRRLPDFF